MRILHTSIGTTTGRAGRLVFDGSCQQHEHIVLFMIEHDPASEALQIRGIRVETLGMCQIDGARYWYRKPSITIYPAVAWMDRYINGYRCEIVFSSWKLISRIIRGVA